MVRLLTLLLWIVIINTGFACFGHAGEQSDGACSDIVWVGDFAAPLSILGFGVKDMDLTFSMPGEGRGYCEELLFWRKNLSRSDHVKYRKVLPGMDLDIGKRLARMGSDMGYLDNPRKRRRPSLCPTGRR